MEPITTLGNILEGEVSRDAIHIAIAPVVASHSLAAGDHVGLNDKGEADDEAAPVGIVDPYLKSKVRKGQRFWMFLYPNTVTGMRHQWSHPSFGPLDATKISHDDHLAKSKAWIEQHADDLGLSSDVLMDNAREWLAGGQDYGNAFVQHGSERWRDNFNPTEFWHHYEAVTGAVVPENMKCSMYCCTC